jgi:hypothetical protein
VVLEVDVEPLAMRGACARHRETHELRADALPTGTFGDHRVEHERMDAAIPGDVDEPDERVFVSRAHPTEAVHLQLSPPVVVEDAMAERRCMQLVDLDVGEPAAPFIRDRHASEASRCFTYSLRRRGTGFTEPTHGATRKAPSSHGGTR